MSKLVIVHHAHHPDEGEEGVYRLIYAEEEQHSRLVDEPNPDYPGDDPGDDEDSVWMPDEDWDREADPLRYHPTRVREEPFLVHTNHVEVVWCAGDPKWKDRAPEDIEAEQRQIVSDTITRLTAERERAEAEAVKNVQHFTGSVGRQL